MTIDRADNDKGYIFNNVVPCCFLCNKIKGSFFNVEEMKRIGVEFVAPKFKAFEDEAMDAYGEWCENNYFDDYDDEDSYEDLDLDI